jgi:alkanesulfonate monooxygenase SsuD/methylene tetrahydromethanopterin reductase-like flavin-dependent oxidoreductase (luciferase family)
MVDFGIFYEIQVASPLKHREREHQVFHQVLEQVPFAERHGFNYFWSVEHHFQPGFSHASAPEVIYGAMSQRTTTMRIGHAVVLLPFPYNHPVRVAERVATLDILSNGRIDMGTGRSASVQELGGFGIPAEETRARWEEALRVILAIWTSKDGTFSYQGQYFDIPERTCVPMPIQRPYPPIWMAASNEASHEIAGRLGLGLLTLTVATPLEEVARRIEMYDVAARDPEPIGPAVNRQKAVFLLAHCAETDTQARDEAERAFMAYVTMAAQTASALKQQTDATLPPGSDAPTRAGFDGGFDPDKITMDYILERGTAVCGNPDTCIRQIEEILRVLKVDQLMLMKQFWAMSHEHTMKSIDLFGKHVIPHFAKQGVKVSAAT